MAPLKSARSRFLAVRKSAPSKNASWARKALQDSIGWREASTGAVGKVDNGNVESKCYATTVCEHLEGGARDVGFPKLCALEVRLIVRVRTHTPPSVAS